jgi:hypothetical protein
VGPHETVRLYAIGDIPEHVAPDTLVDAAITVGDVVLRERATARAVIHFASR